MSRYIPFTKEELYQAHHKDIKEYLESVGEIVLKSGTEHMWEKHDSVKIRGFVWYQHSTGRHGTAVDFLIEFFDFNFQDAVITLLNGKYIATRKTTAMDLANISQPYHQKSKVILPAKNDNNRRLYAYLCGYRKIDKSVVSYFVQKKLIYEERQYHNIVYIGKDKTGVIRFAGLKGTLTDKPYAGELKNSNKIYCFRHIGSSDVLYVFEAFIDLFSYITLYQLDKPWHTFNYLALGGLNPEVFKVFLSSYSHIKSIVICVDNDYESKVNRGQNFAYKLKDTYSDKYRVRIDTPYLKDWNELLKDKKSTT